MLFTKWNWKDYVTVQKEELREELEAQIRQDQEQLAAKEEQIRQMEEEIRRLRRE